MKTYSVIFGEVRVKNRKKLILHLELAATEFLDRGRLIVGSLPSFGRNVAFDLNSALCSVPILCLLEDHFTKGCVLISRENTIPLWEMSRRTELIVVYENDLVVGGDSGSGSINGRHVVSLFALLAGVFLVGVDPICERKKQGRFLQKLEIGFASFQAKEKEGTEKSK